MTLERRLFSALKVAAEDFVRALEFFEPTSGPNAYPERMVSYYYIQALAKALGKSPNVFLEVPFAGKRGGKKDNHIDALVFNDREMVMAEFKRAWTPSQWRSLATDLKRLQGRAGREIRRSFEDSDKRRSFVFLGADCWRADVAKVWKTDSKVRLWTVPPTLRNAHREYLRVFSGKGKDYDGYYLTWALIPLDNMAD